MPPSSKNQVEPMIAEILSLLGKATERLEPDNLGMKQWIVQNFNNPKIAELLQDSTFMMLRVLDAIGRLEPVNGITISKQFRIPKGSVSKATRRLIAAARRSVARFVQTERCFMTADSDDGR